MYACIHEIGRGFFEVVCAYRSATAHLRDPPRPSIREESLGAAIAPVQPKFVQELLGHSSIAMTLDRYRHSIPRMGDQSARAMETVLN